MAAIPLIRHDPGSVFAYSKGQPIAVATFLSDVAHLAQQLPDKPHILNLCTDRYRFAVSFAAALLCRQTSLLPPNYTPSMVENLLQSYPGMYCFTDNTLNFDGVEMVRYPQSSRPNSLPGPAPATIPAIDAEQHAALVFTSGSTGQPVAHPKTWGSLCRGAVAEAASLHIVPNSGLSILGTVPPQHMYGLESCMLLALQNGVALVAERPFFPADICARLAELPLPRCLVTTPVHLRTLLSEAASPPAVEFILCATAHLAPQLAKAAEQRFNAPLYEIFGFTEAGMVASRRTTQGGAWHWLPGIQLRQDGNTTYVRGGHVEIEAALSDVIDHHADGTFTLLGRAADLVNIAGKRTSLSNLNHHLNEIPGVQDGVFVMPDDSDGAMKRTLAFVVAPGLASADILNALRASIDPVFLPRPLYLVDKLPRSASGKITHEALLQLMERCAPHKPRNRS